MCENALAGNAPSEWDISGAGDSSIQGYATDISVNRGQTVSFKINTDSTNYRLDIYRMGYYNGFGARKVATVSPSATLPQVQPSCLTDPTTGLIDCGNWAVSASWLVPATAVSGIYFAKVIRADSGGASHIVFIVRDDTGQSDLLFQTSDTTWQAYNQYGGNNLYVGGPGTNPGRAFKVSYNRPFTVRGTTPGNWVFNAEYPMVRWLESNGYNVSYFTGVDSDRIGSQIVGHKAFLSVGHDEYWSGAQRAHVEAARAGGVHLAFFSGNEVFWKTRWESSISTPATPYRTLVSYKETHANGKIDPDPAWTGTWRDPRFSPPADGGRPENGLTGTIFSVNSGTTGITVPSAQGQMRFWRNTSIANLTPGGSVTLPNGTLGYEWDEDQDNGFRPAGLLRMSDTIVSGVSYLQDYGSTYAPGTANHALTLYRDPSGALVFGAGTVQWSWGLDNNHDGGSAAPSAAMQQATLNLLADMGIQPLTLQPGLTPSIPSSDTIAPTSTITSPLNGAVVPANTFVTISGIATDSGGGVVGGVEISVDGGVTWRRASGRETWTYSWPTGPARTLSILSRAVDDSGHLEQSLGGVSVTVATGTAVCPCSLWTPSQAPSGQAESDPNQVELGTRFRSDVTGYVTGIRFYKPLQNTGTHVGHLWTAGGTLLSSVTFTTESTSGWQEAALPFPVQITAGTLYIVSYNASSGFYAASGSYFATAGVDNGLLHAPKDGTEGGANGVYRYGSNLFPNQTFKSTNYWVDVDFVTSLTDTTPPAVSSVSPAIGSSGVLTGAAVTATFSENVTNVTSATFELTGGSVIPATVTYSSATHTAMLTPSSSLANSTTYTARLKGGVGGITDSAGNPLAADFVWSFTTSAPSSLGCPCTIWPSTQVPGVVTQPDGTAVELGVKFRTSFDGFVTAIRFYKGPKNTGIHVGTLWNSAGASLSTVTFTGETASGWQTATLPQPVAVTANTVYVVSYYAPNGFYSGDSGYFGAAYVNGPLEALASGVAGGNGVYHYGPSAFPTTTFNSTNYWLDVVFDSNLTPGTTAPTVISTSPAANATNVAVASAVSASFSEAMNSGSVNSNTVLLRDAAANLVAATVSYDQVTRQAKLQPRVRLDGSSIYTATVRGGTNGVKDLVGNALAADYTWGFTTGVPPPPPPDEGPGGPIMIVSSTTNPFTKYYAEILRAEGFNAFVVSDITAVTSSTLAAHDVVILGDMTLSSGQVNMFTGWVLNGGKLIAMRPDKQLASLLGLTDASGTLADAYLQVDTSAAPGTGIVGRAMQFHGTADLYTLTGATSLATFYSDATSPTGAPAVTLQSVGAFGGQVAAFTYDLARSVVYTRQGNPAWSGQERDSLSPIRSDDLFFGGSSPDYVDRNNVAIPQADEQQRLLANLIGQLSRDRKPLPRFWYFPRGYKAVVVMTGDDHALGGTSGQFDWFNSRSAPGCSVANWECIRSTSYMFAGGPITPAQVAAYTAQGFEIAAHMWMSGLTAGSSGFSTDCHNYTPASIGADYQLQLGSFNALFPAAEPVRTNRTHCIVWSDYTTQAEVELLNGIRLDTTYYYWPSTWVNNVPGVFTGSAMPMRFAKTDGTTIDVYQAPTQMTDESGQGYPFTVETLLDRALGPEGYYGAYVANMHTDLASHPGAQAIVASAQARGVPVISARQLLDWLDGRNSATYSGLTWVGDALTFSVSAEARANGLQTLVPAGAGNRSVTGVTRDGQPIGFALQGLKGMNYAVFDAAPGNYSVQYSVDSTAPSITGLAVSPDAFEATVTWTTSEVASSRVDYGTSPNALNSSVTIVDATTLHAVKLKGLASSTTYYFRATSSDLAGNTAVAPTVPAPPMYFTTLATPTFGCPCSIWRPQQAPLQPSAADANAIEVGVKFKPLADGYVTGVRFYKGALNTGPHVGNLWTSSGTLLGSVTFSNESATGWQQATLSQPVAVTANTTYVVSYHTNAGGYSADLQYFQQSGVTSGPLQALAEGVSGSNGVFRYGGTAFPTQSFSSANYWVDLVFVAVLPTNSPSQALTDTTTVDFAGGTLGSGASLSETTNGEVILAPAVGTEFSGTSVPSGWTATSQSSGGAAVVGNGRLTVDGMRVGLDALLPPGQSLEATATFSNDLFEHLGFGITLNETPWAIFSTAGGGGLYARTHDGVTATDTLIPGNWLGTPHRYRIDRNTSSVVFFIDGVQVASHPVTIASSLRPIASDVNAGSGALSVDWIRLSPYATAGTFTSRVLDQGTGGAWASASWSALIPSGTSLAVSARFGNTAVPDSTWTAFGSLTNGGVLTQTSRYVQYAADMTGNGTATPVLQDITFAFGILGPTIASANNATFTAGVGGAFRITATGSAVPTLTMTGVLPGGVTFTDYHDGTGYLSGTPSTNGVFTVTITASSAGGTVSQTFTLTVNQAPTITSASSTRFTAGTVGTFIVTASGRPVPTISESGALANGITFVDNGNGTGTLSGAPAAGTSGTYNITFAASNGVGSNAVQSFSLTVVNPAAPTLTSITPNTGPRGTAVPVTLTGSNFSASGTSVAVSGTGVTVGTITVVNATTITTTFTISATATLSARNVTVTTPGGTSGAIPFTLTASALTSINPTSGARGTSVPVTLTGSGLTGATAITVSGTGVTPSGLTVVNDTTVTATFAIAANATLSARTVSVQAPIGTTNTVTFTVVAPPLPTLTSVAPISALRGTAVAVTLTGTNFTNTGTTVAVSGTGVTVGTISVVNPTTITTTFTISATAAVGARNVTVTTPAGLSNAATFTLLGPALASISPTSGARGTSVPVTLTGSGLTGATAITVSGSGVTISGLSVVNDTTVTATFTISATATVGARNVTISAPGGTSNAVTLTLTASTLTSISPASGARGTSVPVTLTGSGLTGATAITVSGTGVTASGLTVVDDTTVTTTFIVAANATLSARTVSVQAPLGTSNTMTFTVVAPPLPTLTSVAPSTFVRGTTITSVTLTGTNFTTTGTTVAVAPAGGITLSAVTILNSTTITATFAIASGTTAALGAHNVTVTNPAGASNTMPITVQGPTLVSVSPNPVTRGTGVLLTLTGTNLTGATAVTVSGNSCTVTGSTSTTVSATCTLTAGTRNVSATTPIGTTGTVSLTVN